MKSQGNTLKSIIIAVLAVCLITPTLVGCVTNADGSRSLDPEVAKLLIERGFFFFDIYLAKKAERDALEAENKVDNVDRIAAIGAEMARVITAFDAVRTQLINAGAPLPDNFPKRLDM